MLTVHQWSVERRELDFSSSGLPNPIVQAIRVDGELLCNAYELTAWEAEEDRMQLIICGHCGTIACEPGGWVTFRRAGASIFAIPLLRDLLGGDDRRQTEYQPPDIIRKRGVVLFSLDMYLRFRQGFPAFPDAESMRPLAYGEALRIFQIDAPGAVLGDPCHGPDDPRRLDLALAASAGNATELCERVARIMDNGLFCAEPAVVRPPGREEVPITLYLDLPNIPEWKVFWKGKTDGLYLSPEHRLEIMDDR